jgi:hypothetical protein
MNFTIKLKQIDSVELSGFISDVVGESGGSVVSGSNITGYAQSIPSGVSGVDISWSSRPSYINMTVHSSGAGDPLLMGNLRGFNSTGCSFLLSEATSSPNYFLHLSYPV